MKKNLKYSEKDHFKLKLESYSQDGRIPKKYQEVLKGFYDSYNQVVEKNIKQTNSYSEIFCDFLDLICNQLAHPFPFEPYHKKIRSPYDFYRFGINFITPLVKLEESSVMGQENLHEIVERMKRKENVILLANHQIEADPQAISLLLDPLAPELAENMIFVAGERVTTDPLAAPFSKGRNLLCIYSKRYIDHPPENKLKKQMHNRRTMELMSELLSEGSKCIYVAPSGGRDRPNAHGKVEVARFDPQSVEMLYLMAKKSAHPTFFYPLALSTYKLLPPPEAVQKELGESRITKGGGIHLAFGDCLCMETFPGNDLQDKSLRRKARADYIWEIVCNHYAKFPI